MAAHAKDVLWPALTVLTSMSTELWSWTWRAKRVCPCVTYTIETQAYGLVCNPISALWETSIRNEFHHPASGKTPFCCRISQVWSVHWISWSMAWRVTLDKEWCPPEKLVHVSTMLCLVVFNMEIWFTAITIRECGSPVLRYHWLRRCSQLPPSSYWIPGHPWEAGGHRIHHLLDQTIELVSYHRVRLCFFYFYSLWHTEISWSRMGGQ